MRMVLEWIGVARVPTETSPEGTLTMRMALEWIGEMLEALLGGRVVSVMGVAEEVE